MTALLYCAAGAALALGAAHSLLGERYILGRLFRRDALPELFGGTAFTRRTLRFAWHLDTVAWWGFAGVLVLLARNAVTPRNLSLALAATFLATATVTMVVSRGRHLSWPLFLFIGIVCLAAALG